MNPTTELEKLQSELQRKKQKIEKYRTVLLEFGSDCGADFMQEKFKESGYSTLEYCEFCEEYCPFDECKWDCFAKEKEEMCEEMLCDRCPDLNFCESPHGKDWREEAVPTIAQLNSGSV